MKTFLKVLSVLMIIGAVISIIVGIIAIVGGGSVAVLGVSEDPSLSNEDTATAAVAGIVVILLGIIAIIAAVFNLLTGIFGWKGANGNQGKLKAALVMGWISLALCIVNVIIAIVEKTDVSSSLLSLIMPALFVAAATYAKKTNSLEG